ncbi:hypothetical protein KDL01_19490 [Actinospica durhamensis]|uniref:Uncharacterized protein n=1 Tax=Actinospica durhamensis TaxID=1508375 RepID=A0A941IT07_9ACTN|nr:hypothetical protein [Actinospica durhamensis]MBR7835468.1 hypothetical protein [Actinospica durhamensis]
MQGYMNEQANLAYIAQRQADFETAARHSRLIRALKSARRDRHDQPTAAGRRTRPRCASDLG